MSDLPPPACELPIATGLILDGGRATRWGGRHKAFVEVAGRSIAERTVELFGRLFAATLAATTRPEPWRRLGVTVVEDPIPDAGPLAGIAAGLLAARTPLLVVAASDMPFLSGAVLAELVARARRSDSAAVPVLDGRPEPLHAVYPTRLAEPVLAALAAGTRKVTELLAAVDTEWVDAAELAHLPGASRSFVNLNTPGDLESLEPD